MLIFFKYGEEEEEEEERRSVCCEIRDSRLFYWGVLPMVLLMNN